MLRTGFVGWRGMVGSVLMGRMREEQDFEGFEASLSFLPPPMWAEKVLRWVLRSLR